jgi:phenylalanine-4-hydroxylase
MQISVRDYARECAEQGLRGDYSLCRADFTVDQAYDYSLADQTVWRTLCDRQTKLTRKAGAQDPISTASRRSVCWTASPTSPRSQRAS